jgi:hypothetical protein
MPIYIGYIDGHSIMQESFKIVETMQIDGVKTISLMVDDIAIINN